MKKLLALFLLLPLLFSCSSDDKEDGNDFRYIQFYAKYNYTADVSYKVHIYKGGLSDYKSFHTGHYSLPATARDLNGEIVFPINIADGVMSEDSRNLYNGYAVNSFYPNKYDVSLDNLYTIQFIVIVYGKGYFQCVKSFDIDKNTAIRLKFHKLTNFDKKDIEGDWQVVDASKENFRDLIDFD